jgi:mRNA interferase HigB
VSKKPSERVHLTAGGSSRLVEFWEKHSDAETTLRGWFKTVEKADWNSFSDLKRCFGSADVIQGNRAVVSIKGNKYRLVLKINYDWNIAYIRFIGTHAEYVRIDAETV